MIFLVIGMCILATDPLLYLCAVVSGCVRLCVVVCGCVRLCVDVCGCLRLCAVVCGCEHLCVVVCGCVRVLVRALFSITYSWGIKGFNKSLFYGVKLP